MIKDVLNFWLKNFCFAWVLIQIITESTGLNFDTLALGHSGLLITWDPNNVKMDGDHKYNYDYFKFTCQTFPEKSANITSEKVMPDMGLYQISMLNTNTRYQINITHHKYDNSVIKKYYVQAKTGLKTNSLPPKPDFNQGAFVNDDFPNIRIVWLPCGKYRKCNEFVPTTHFSVQYRMLESKQLYESGDIYTGYYDIRGTHILPGIIYEVTVFSINGGLKTNSDTKEVFIKAASGAVRNVKVVPRDDSSSFLVFKPPLNQINPITRYQMSFNKSSSDDGKSANSWLIRNNFGRVTLSLLNQNKNRNYYHHTVIEGIQLATEYNIYIIPVMENVTTNQKFYGLAYLFNYISHRESIRNLPIAIPDFRYELIGTNSNGCQIGYQWLPYGLEFEYNNSRPVLYFRTRVKNKKTDEVIFSKYTEKKDFMVNIRLVKNESYEIMIETFDGPYPNQLPINLTKTVDGSICDNNE